MRRLRRLQPLIAPLFRMQARLARGLTLGVRVLVRDPAGRILLIEHTYIPGWHFPGGGVERKENALDAAMRETREEAGVVMTTAPTLFSFHDNGASFPGDHVLVYHANAYETEAVDNRVEIADLGWFAPDALPEGTTRGTRARILEALGQKEIDPNW